MKKLIVTDPVWICGSDLIGSDIRNFGWEARMYGIWHPSSLSRESLAHIPRFSLSVAVLWVEYIPCAWVLLQSFLPYSFPPFHPCSWASPFSILPSFKNRLMKKCNSTISHSPLAWICLLACTAHQFMSFLNQIQINFISL